MILKVNDNGTIRQYDLAQKSEMPTKVSDLVNDSGFVSTGIFIGSTTPNGYTLYIDPDNSLSRGEGVSF